MAGKKKSKKEKKKPKKAVKSKKCKKSTNKSNKKTSKKSSKKQKKATKSSKKGKKTTKKATKTSKSKSKVKSVKKTKATKKGKKTKSKAKKSKKETKKVTKKKTKKETKKKEKKNVKKEKSKKEKPKPVEEEDEIKIIKLQPEEETVENKEEKIVIEFEDEEETGKEGEEEKQEGKQDYHTAEEIIEEEKSKIKKPQMRCPECGSTNLRWDYERAELVCMDCGTVIEESMIDFGPEWRAFDSYQKTKRQRTGSPIKYTKPNKGLVTEIDKYNRDIRGGKLSPQAASQMGRLRKWHKRSSIASSIERNLTIAMGDLERISSYLGLPANIREAAALLYRKAVEKGLIRGRLIESVVAAVIYMVCRQYGIPRTLDEISEISGISKKEIGRTYRFLKKELYVDVPLTNPIYYVPRFASALGLSGKVQEKAKDILNEAVEKGLISGRGPTGVAAAAVYIASVMMGERRTQKEVAEVAGVTEVTIRNRYRELKRELNIEIDED